MPERPDLDYFIPILHEALAGRTLHRLEVKNPVLMRILVSGDPAELLAGRRLSAVERRGAFVRMLIGAELELTIHPMLAGRFQLTKPSERVTKDTGLILDFGDGVELRYRDDKQMGKIYLLPRGQFGLAPGLADVGLDVLSPDFTPEAFRALAKGRRDQVKGFLLDKKALDSLGNAYADEALHAAGVHPKARVSDLDETQLERLREAIVRVLREANAELARRHPATHEKVRDFLKVRGRKGQPCPTCGEPIRVAGVRGHDAFYCARCQPDTAGRGFSGWRR
ncbi:MAG: Fpg/Nei family DNA glycosylase [Alphaproteobacteria bacterium]|nr:Fpg/Nei family DNA glycosylase [Alphaproteobacteria bacterium]